METNKKTIKEKIVTFFKWLGAIFVGIGATFLFLILGKDKREEELEERKSEIKETIAENLNQVDEIKIKQEDKKNNEKKFFPDLD